VGKPKYTKVQREPVPKPKPPKPAGMLTHAGRREGAASPSRLAHKCPHCWSLPGPPPTDGKRQDKEEARA